GGCHCTAAEPLRPAGRSCLSEPVLPGVHVNRLPGPTAESVFRAMEFRRGTAAQARLGLERRLHWFAHFEDQPSCGRGSADTVHSDSAWANSFSTGSQLHPAVLGLVVWAAGIHV